MKSQTFLTLLGVHIFLLTIVLTVMLVFTFSLEEKTHVIVKTNVGNEEYISTFNFTKGDNVIIYGPNFKKNVIPNSKEFFVKTTIPIEFFPVLKDTILNFNYGPSKDITQEVRIGIVDSVFRKNIFQ